MATIGKYGKIIFSETDIEFIKENFQNMTNQQIADALGLKQTVVRMKAYELGLKRMTMEYWPDEATQYLKDNFRTKGNREIVRHFKKHFPKDKGWSTNHIDKKLEQLGLKRNKLDWYVIKERNRDNGSFGKKNPKNNPSPPVAYVYLNPKTRVVLKPGQTPESIKEKYQHLIR